VCVCVCVCFLLLSEFFFDELSWLILRRPKKMIVGCGNASKPSCSTVSRVRRAVCGRALSCNRITLCVSSTLRFVHIAVLSLFSRLQYDDAFTVLPCSWNSTNNTPLMSQNTVDITLLAEGTTLNLVGVGDSLCFHCLEAYFVSGW